MTLKLYFDFLSQPSRAVYIFLKLNNIPFEPCQVALTKGEHLTEEFKAKFNRFQKVPFIHDGDFKLSESIAIIRYLSKRFDLDNNWYPKDPKKQAQIDEYLEWHHNNTRMSCVLYFQKKWVIPMLTDTKPDAKQLQKLEAKLTSCMDTIESLWLTDTPYLSGNKISIADIFAACEIEQPRIAGFDPTEGKPVLRAWIEKIRKECSPYYEEAHTILNNFAAQGGKAKL